ncbi:MAG: hypothetical protein R3B95_11820 [Nitrospirales bacterium]|nr:hypothetical protein [Nitrospirales bacterium]
MPNAYPLSWPDGWKRTNPVSRQFGRFNTKRRVTSSSNSNFSYQHSEKISVAQARARVMESLRLLGVDYREVILSTNLDVRLDGLPRSGQKAPIDPGVAIYWKKSKDQAYKVMAIDQYQKVEDNLAAIAATLDAMRAIERHGGAVILERAFTGFSALPSPNDWRHIMGFEDTPTLELVREQYRKLAKQRHPDSGGSEAMMSELNRAMDDAERELTFA